MYILSLTHYLVSVLAANALFDFMIIADVEVRKVLLFEDQYTLTCEDNIAPSVQWFYQEQQDDTPLPIFQLQDTSYIPSGPKLHLTNIKAEHEGFYSCNQMSTVYHLVVLGKWKGMYIALIY